MYLKKRTLFLVVIDVKTLYNKNSTNKNNYYQREK